MAAQTLVLPELIESHKREITSYREEGARESIKQLLSQPLLPMEQAKIYDMLEKFVTLNFVYQLAQRYPIISDEIFELKRQEKRSKERGEYIIDFPVVVKIPLQSQKIGKNFEMEIKGTKKKSDESYDRTAEFKISCSIPELTPEARVAFSDAVRYSAELTSKAYEDNLLSRILIRDRMYGRALDGPLTADYHLIWAPSVWNTEVIERDPAIFMRYAGTNLLVYHWNILEERSLDAMLREFTGNFKLSIPEES